MAQHIPPSSLEEALNRAMKLPATQPQQLPSDTTAMHPGRRNVRGSSMGVTRHKRTQRFEAHIWLDKKQVYLGAYDSEVQAARGHDIMALRSKGMACELNYPRQDYAGLLPLLLQRPQADVVAALRNYSKSLSGTKQRSSSSSSNRAGAGRAAREKRKVDGEGVGPSWVPPSGSHQAGAAAAGGRAAAAADGREVGQGGAAAAAGAEPTWQSPRLRQRREASAQQAAAAGAGPGGDRSAPDAGGSPFLTLSITPLQVRPSDRPPPGNSSAAAGAAHAEAVLHLDRDDSMQLTQQQCALSTAGSLQGPMSPTSSLAVRNLLALANQGSLQLPPQSPEAPAGSMPPPPPLPPLVRRTLAAAPGVQPSHTAPPVALQPQQWMFAGGGGPYFPAPFLAQQLQCAGLTPEFVQQLLAGPVQASGLEGLRLFAVPVTPLQQQPAHLPPTAVTLLSEASQVAMPTASTAAAPREAKQAGAAVAAAPTLLWPSLPIAGAAAQPRHQQQQQEEEQQQEQGHVLGALPPPGPCDPARALPQLLGSTLPPEVAAHAAQEMMSLEGVLQASQAAHR